ncbi:Asp-tRNA(Asn)/Glu-tRNA(Gln) amidotransferase subunit GatB [Mahella sp.]|uniref:Asp-tRNA(Asn)/Glu-tRNA(Gln) amidotransferase subunit GatB n=1 Tax=Mahella sp. TaxID=2798721 RepID=UPI0025B87917|nr:Asp-tRNA(Asn)/Glu-tRNA(Gln) amidotransferase subunit GatB [Mahella sp.]MBZ4665503.1 aspartyl/glutamyl-tRNA(Asn/Gln) amidotransferase subunit [Mahella sp.]
MEVQTLIGLEVHAELATESKMFCSCSTEFGAEPNTHCCPICTGMPGVLPMPNKKAIEYAVKAGLALNCDISEFSKMDRKNYYYPDLPKAYQISQYDLPLCTGGYVDIETEDGPKRIRIRRVHMEEDAGKLLHEGWGNNSLVDYNRAGVPLIEIVTEPDMNSPAEAGAFLDKLKAILQYIEVSDCKMEEGSLRCDVNINARADDKSMATAITEMKNLNSFKAAVKAMEYEEKRHREALLEGDPTVHETRRWDDARSVTVAMRSKEEAHDYRYFPEPDLVPIALDKSYIKSIRENLPELPDQRYQRFISQYGLPQYDAGILTSSKYLADYFEQCMTIYDNAKTVSNWLMGDVLRALNENGKDPSDIPFPPAYLVDLIKYVDDGTISISIAKKVFDEMFANGTDPGAIIKEQGLVQISDEGELLGVIRQVIQENAPSVADYKAGKKKALGYLVGQAMKLTKGKANPQLLNKLLERELN